MLEPIPFGSGISKGLRRLPGSIVADTLVRDLVPQDKIFLVYDRRFLADPMGWMACLQYSPLSDDASEGDDGVQARSIVAWIIWLVTGRALIQILME